MRNDFIEHSAKGKEWINHRYVAKVRLPSGKMFYFYDSNAYQNYLKRMNGGSVSRPKQTGELAKKDPYKEIRSNTSLSRYSSMTTQQKKQKTADLMANGRFNGTKAVAKASMSNEQQVSEGKAKAEEVLAKAKGASTTGSAKDTTKKGKGSSSKKSSSAKKSGASKSGSSSKTSGSKKEKAASEKKASSSSAKSANAKEQTNSQQEEKKEKSTFDNLREMAGVSEKAVNVHKSIQKMLAHMQNYQDGAKGYIQAGNKVYRWTKRNGKLIFTDLKSDKEVSLDEAVKNIKEFRTDNVMRKKK